LSTLSYPPTPDFGLSLSMGRFCLFQGSRSPYLFSQTISPLDFPPGLITPLSLLSLPPFVTFFFHCFPHFRRQFPACVYPGRRVLFSFFFSFPSAHSFLLHPNFFWSKRFFPYSNPPRFAPPPLKFGTMVVFPCPRFFPVGVVVSLLPFLPIRKRVCCDRLTPTFSKPLFPPPPPHFVGVFKTWFFEYFSCPPSVSVSIVFCFYRVCRARLLSPALYLSECPWFSDSGL